MQLLSTQDIQTADKVQNSLHAHFCQPSYFPISMVFPTALSRSVSKFIRGIRLITLYRTDMQGTKCFRRLSKSVFDIKITCFYKLRPQSHDPSEPIGTQHSPLLQCISHPNITLFDHFPGNHSSLADSNRRRVLLEMGFSTRPGSHYK